jgi:Xaa-Pro aminopeptidase
MDRSRTEKRITSFQKILSRDNIDIAFVSCLSNKDSNLQYYIGKEIDAGFLIIPKKGNSIFLASKMEYERAKQCLSDAKKVKVLKFEKPVSEQIGKLIKKYHPKTIGMNNGIISVNEFTAIKKGISKSLKVKKKIVRFVDISRMLLDKRSVKDEIEIGMIKKACKISDDIFRKTFANLKSLKTEEDIRQFMTKETQKLSLKTSFEPLVASGKNSSLPHYLGEKVKIKKGFLFVDFGVEYKGYKSDTTRVMYKGKPTKTELMKYAHLLDVQTKLVDMIRPGVECSLLYNTANLLLGKDAKYFTHNLGHGVGIEIHESPNLYSESKTVLEPGMIVTIEPGIYFPGNFGIRIEDTVLVTKKGNRILTKTGKDLLLIR